MNIPRGPEEVAEVWRAWARMQLGVHGCYVWGDGLPEGGIHFGTVSRVTEKGGWHTAYVLQDVLDWLQSNNYLRNCTDLVFWSDGAPTYKCVVMCSFVGYHWLQRYGCTGKEITLTTHQKFGEPHHLKGALDRWFGQVEGRMRAAEVQKMIRTIDDAVEAISVEGTATREVIKISLPTITKPDWIAMHKLMQRSTLPAGIRSTNYYSWRMTDHRLKTLVSDDGLRLTGVRASSHGIPGLKADPETTKTRDHAVWLQRVHTESENEEGEKPKEEKNVEEERHAEAKEENDKDNATEDGAESDDTGASGPEQDFDADGNQVLHEKTKEWLGWRCSYLPYQTGIVQQEKSSETAQG